MEIAKMESMSQVAEKVDSYQQKSKSHSSHSHPHAHSQKSKPTAPKQTPPNNPKISNIEIPKFEPKKVVPEVAKHELVEESDQIIVKFELPSLVIHQTILKNF
jgi:hypothetical protein